MDSALIVSGSDKSLDFYTQALREIAISDANTVSTCAQGRRYLSSRPVDLCIINAPLQDEFGDSFAMYAIGTANQVILVVRSEVFDDVSRKVETQGILTLARPLSKTVFWSALKLASAAYYRVNQLSVENAKLQQSLDDIRVINRAKGLLMRHLGMTEDESHKFIERQSMDLRISRRETATNIIQTYQ